MQLRSLPLNKAKEPPCGSFALLHTSLHGACFAETFQHHQ